MASVKILLWKHHKKKDETCPLVLRIIKDRKPRYIFTGEYILEKDWNPDEAKVRKSHPNSSRLNNFLLKKLSEAHDTALELNTRDATETASGIKRKIVNVADSDFFSVADSFLANLKKRKKIPQYRTDKHRIQTFKTYVGKSKLPFIDVNVVLLKKYQYHLRYTKKNSQRTVMNAMIMVRTIFNVAISESIVDRKHYPFGKGKIQIKFPETDKVGLNVEEVQLLENVEGLTEAQQHALNVWLISFYFAGVRISDVLQLKWSDFRDDRLYYRMNKNEKMVSLKVPDKAQVLLDIYKKKRQRGNDLVFKELRGTKLTDIDRVVTRTKTVTRNFNKHLKKIAEKVGITKKLSMHIARHSFGNISGSKIPVQMLQKLYRHSSITTTMNYQKNFIHEETDEALDSVVDF